MKMIMIGPVPEPFTGQSVSFKKLKDTLSLDEGLELFHVDTSPRASLAHVTGKLRFDRMLETLKVLAVYFYYLIVKRPNVIYLTKGSTTFGFLRDFIFVFLNFFFNRKSKFVVHLKGGNYDEFFNSSPWVLKHLIKLFISKVDTIIVLGESLVRMYDFFPAASQKIVVIENALTFEVGLEDVSVNNSGVTFVYLSNLIVSKGYLDLAEAAQRLSQKGCVRFRLIFAGEFMLSPDDPDDVVLRQNRFLKLVNENDNIDYIGSVSGAEKNNLLSSADVLVLPTNYHVEGQPNCIIEAMAYSCAIISTNYRSIPDLIDHTNGFFVDYGSVDQLCQKMTCFINNKEDAVRMGASSKLIYDSKFVWKIHYNKMYKVLFG